MNDKTAHPAWRSARPVFPRPSAANFDTPIAAMGAAALLVVLSAAIRLTALRHTINWYNEEPFFYLHDTIRFLTQPSAFPLMDNHPSGYQYLLAFLTRLLAIHDLVALGRWLSWFCGVLTVIPLFYLARRNLGFWPAWFAGAALAIYDTHILLSVNSLNFAPFFFFLLLAFWLLGEGLSPTASASLSWAALIGAAFSLAAANTLRFESWLFIAPLAIVLAWRKRWGKALAFTAIAALYPLLYLFFARLKYGTPFPFLEVSGGIDRAFAGLLDWRALGVWGRELYLVLGPVPLIAGVLGLALGLRRHYKKEMLLYLGLVAAFYAIRTMRHRFIFAGVFPRYDVLLLLFILPYLFSAAIDGTHPPKTARPLGAIARALPILLLFGWQSLGNYQQMARVEGLRAAPPATQGLIAWMNRELGPDDRVCTDYWLHPTISFALVEAKGLDSPPYFYAYHACLEHGRHCNLSAEQWRQTSRETLARERCNIAITKDDEPLASVLSAPDAVFASVAEIAPYRIYRAAP